MMSKVTMKVEFNPGITIEEAIIEGIRLATILNVYIEFNFNGIIVSTHSRSSVTNGVEQYRKALRRDNLKFVLA
jgi:hypothetical protein